MQMFLQIIGVLALGVVVVIVAIYLYIRISLGKYAKVDTEKDATPLLIHLNEDVIANWTKEKNAKALEDELLDLGFEAGKAYSIVEMDGMLLKAFFHTNYCAVLYKHDIAGVWVDMVANGVDGIEYTVSNAPMGGGMDTPSYAQKHLLLNLPLNTLFAKLVEITSDKPLDSFNPDNFREYFELSYKREMKWRSKNGGISLEEFVRIAEAEGKKFKDSDILEAYRETKQKELMRWHNAAILEYKQKENIPENDCHDIMDFLFIVPIQTDAVAFIRYLEDVYFLSEEQADKFEDRYNDEEIEPQVLFQRINESLSTSLRAVKKGDSDYPIEIDIYEMPKKEYDW